MCGRKPCKLILCTYSEGWRRICEARTVMRWSKLERKAFYALVAVKRGEMAAMQLMTDVRLVWAANNAAA